MGCQQILHTITLGSAIVLNQSIIVTQSECSAVSNNISRLLVFISGMWSIPSLSLLPGPLWPRVVALARVLSMGQLEQTVLSCDCYITILETI